MDRRRVVITGLGCITALSESVEELFTALCEGRSGVSTIESFDASAYPVHFGGEIKNFDVTRYIDRREAKRMDRFSEFAVAAAIQAVKDSGLDFAKEDPYRVGAIVGTGIGGIKEIEEQHVRLLEKGPSKVSPFCVPRLMSNAASGNIAIQFGLRGPSFAVSSACASGNHTIGEAFWNIASGRSDVIVTGGSEAACTPIGLGSFCAARSLSTRNDSPTDRLQAVRPGPGWLRPGRRRRHPGPRRTTSTPGNAARGSTPSCSAMRRPTTAITSPPRCPTAPARRWP